MAYTSFHQEAEEDSLVRSGDHPRTAISLFNPTLTLSTNITRQMDNWKRDALTILHPKRLSKAVYAALGFLLLCLTTFWFFRTVQLARVGQECFSLVKSVDDHYSHKVSLVEDNGFGYVFYATADHYACSAMINIHLLQTKFKTPYPIYALVSPGLSDYYKNLFKKNNVTVIVDEPPPLNKGAGYYKDVLLKLYAFRMHHYVPSLKRVVIMDSDQLIFGELDSLFQLPDVRFASPRAYWIHDAELSSTLMVITLSDETWNIVENALKNIGPDTYDMDLVNQMFSNSALTLPGQYITLNSHWEAWDLPTWYTGEPKLHIFDNDERSLNSSYQAMEGLFDAARVVHFYAIGKPWDYSEKIAAASRPDAHPILAKQFGIWNELSEKVSCKYGLDQLESKTTDQ